MRKFKTKITELLGIEHPILCGGMQWISRAELAVAVANAGGLGFMTAESFETPEDLRAEIKKVRSLTDKPFGVNISMVPEFGLPERTLKFCEVVCQEGVKVVETAGRSPEPLMPQFQNTPNIKVQETEISRLFRPPWSLLRLRLIYLKYNRYFNTFQIQTCNIYGLFQENQYHRTIP